MAKWLSSVVLIFIGKVHKLILERYVGEIPTPHFRVISRARPMSCLLHSGTAIDIVYLMKTAMKIVF